MKSLDRRILTLAVPALATLVAEPLLVVADTVIVGMLGTSELAGLTIASNVLGVVVGMSIFLAYGTTSTVSRRLGAGDRAGALQCGIDGMVLGALIGIVLASGMALLAPDVLALYGASEAATGHGVTYLRVVAAGVPAQLVIMASTGVLRGLQDTRTPLYVMAGITVLNVGLNILFVFGLHLGIGGAALGTAISMWIGGTTFAVVVFRAGRAEGVGFRVAPGDVLRAARSGGWLVLRSAALHTALVVTTYSAAGFGEVSLAAHQAANSVWMTATYAMDALAIAAQALVGLSLGAGDVPAARGVLRRVLLWGAGFGALIGLLLVISLPVVPAAFSPDAEVQAVLRATLPVLALILPLGAFTFMYDGVLIGAGDARYLSLAAVAATAVYVPFALWTRAENIGLPWLWGAYGIWLAARAATLRWRVRTDQWARRVVPDG
ncbi:MAG TPA: MATE family efflux transporter [Actinomycetaceae bacterium]|nr:MATE family efflux transporter [Actinomycetaceae bacterium]